MKERESVKKVYDEIHAPEALLRKVMEMNKKDFKFRNAVKFVAMAAAVQVCLQAHQALAQLPHLQLLLVHQEQRIPQRRPLAHARQPAQLLHSLLQYFRR